jgi:hypothetical protein
MVLAFVCSVALSRQAGVDLFAICFDGIPPNQVTPASQSEPIPDPIQPRWATACARQQRRHSPHLPVDRLSGFIKRGLLWLVDYRSLAAQKTGVIVRGETDRR